MIHIVWEFQVDPGNQQEFEKHYCATGTWVQLFRHDSAFHGTNLLRDRETPGRYLTVDCWRNLESYEAFRVRFAGEYQEIDLQMQHLTTRETRIGVFEAL